MSGKALCDMIGKEYLDGYEQRVYTLPGDGGRKTPDRAGDIVRVARRLNFDSLLSQKIPWLCFVTSMIISLLVLLLRIGVDTVSKSIPAERAVSRRSSRFFGNVSDLVYKILRPQIFLPACSIGFLPASGGANSPVDNAERSTYRFRENRDRI